MNGIKDMSGNKKYEPVPIFTISSLEALKVAADPLRNQIMELIEPAPTTVSVIAQKLGLSPNKLYYHISLLEKHGFIQVVETVVRGNLIEKKYWLTAYDFDIDNDLMNFGSPEGRENTKSMYLSFVEATRDDLRRSIDVRASKLESGVDPDPQKVILDRVSVKIPREKSEEFVEKFSKLINEFCAEDQPDSDDQNWALSVFLFPSFYFKGAEVDADGKLTEN